MRRHLIAWSTLALAFAVRMPAQGRDPMHEIQEIARAVEEQLQEIDRLLLESGKQNQARTKPKQMLEEASERGATVQDGIDRLIEKLTEMKNQSGSSSGEGEPQPNQGQQQPRPQGQPQNRRESGTPDFVQQPQEGQEGEQPTPQPQNGMPQSGQEANDTAENRPGDKPPDGATGPGQQAQGSETWGELQPYVNFLKNRGSSPKVPEKFRKYWEAYLKQKQGGGR